MSIQYRSVASPGSKFRCQFVWKTLVLAGLLAVTVTQIAAPAIARSGRRYTPPQGQSAPSSNSVGGARSGGCTGSGNTAFTALAPLGHVGQTAATRPTFSWYVPDSASLPIDFRLFVYRSDGRLEPRPVYQTEIPSTSGVMSFTLPLSEAELKVGSRYYWRASLICDSNHRSEDLIVGADLAIVENTVPESERWYDLLQTRLNGSTSAQAIDELLSQLAAVERTMGEALAQSSKAAPAGDQLELEEQSQDVLQQSEHLTQIVEAAESGI